ncbi:tetratricopeptide repeat protein [Taylorella equigenitalis]|uniref:tetratricopeptide repeat protein n=1 Tax=Taylorella equigenitalis TaxID=29575 RepID=UPI00237D56CB|nr:tetratricopeptide repeat protein [Taylorella equigenitalis]WEE00958.1 tetratricopeptide repeat protein [Taylorella equigenitalis]WEE02436.1 tetratricopeptide repeat protein [Taylorella equigenitalis]WFD78975.1 tetratricopeptide repeat protein [Taylorella equigenitalis]WFD80449.1 tetratricopeptide repeat protein [Taylorella equigenitalis]WFD81928.1 tetratricopeptide repeat protein [Taylorella equigenitalis]
MNKLRISLLAIMVGTVALPAYTKEKDYSNEGGSETVAKFFDVFTPAVDTSIPENRTQLAQRINSLISAGHLDEALKEVKKNQKEDLIHIDPQIDVQLLFLEARIYQAKGNIKVALETYRNMTNNYPELAEPWNNMAVIQLRLGLIEEAKDSLEQAIAINPDYGLAHKNLGYVYMVKSREHFQKAGSLGVSGASAHSKKLDSLIKGK